MDELPPTIRLLLDEDVFSLTFDSLNKLFKKGFLKDLKTQAEYTLKDWTYPITPHTSSSGDFATVPTGPLNPFSPSQKCYALPCRIDSARAFARSVALYSEYVVIPDVFSRLFYHSHGDDHPTGIFQEVAVLKELFPLIRQGIIRFSRPSLFLCEHHLQEKKELVLQTTDALLTMTKSAFRVRVREGEQVDYYQFLNPLLGEDDETLWHDVPKVESRNILSQFRRRPGGLLPKDAIKAFVPRLRILYFQDTQRILEALNVARLSHAQLTTGSRRDALFLNYVNKPVTIQDAENWERLRAIDLPWIKDLTVDEVIQLRESAGLALERLRVQLMDRVSKPNFNDAEIAAELESQALEVRSEMESWKAGRGRQFEILYGGLGVSLIAYGLAHDALLAAAAAIFTAVGNVFRDKKTESVETAKLEGKPGFALLRARDLLGHRKHIANE